MLTPPPLPTIRKGRPSAAFLIILSGLIFFGLLAWEIGDLMGVILSAYLTILVSAIWQGIAFFIDDHRKLSNYARISIYFAPVGILVLLLAVSMFREKENQKNPSLSSSGHYELTVSDRNGWDFHFKDRQTQETIDCRTPFLAQDKLFWMWDSADRLWIFNNDEQSFSYFTSEKGKWIFHKAGFYHQREDPVWFIEREDNSSVEKPRPPSNLAR
jgi:hypothetical protein